jgi:hypothetical protein
VHKRGTLKSCSTQNIIFIQQNWAEIINVLHYFLGAPRDIRQSKIAVTKKYENEKSRIMGNEWNTAEA